MDDDTKAKLIQTICSLTTDNMTLQLAKWTQMSPNGEAAKHLDQYLLGKGDLRVDIQKVLREDAKVRLKVHSFIVAALRDGQTSGTVPIPQRDYSNKDWQFAIGSMNINWTFPSYLGSDKVHIGFRNEYRWHPNDARITQCVHQAADRLRTGIARNYWMEGSAEVTLWIIELGFPARFHIVTFGDTLASLALKYYHDAAGAKRIAEYNASRIKNPEQLPIGTVLEIPEAI